MRTSYLACALVFALTNIASGQSGSQGVVGVDAFGPPNVVEAGSTFEASVHLRIKPGFHINAQKPSEDFLVGTSVDLNLPKGISIVKFNYPATRYAKFEFSETPLAVYEGTAKINVRLRADATAAMGPQHIPGTVTFQACNDSQCLQPATVNIKIPVEIGSAEAAPTNDNAATKPDETTTQTLTVTGAPPNAQVSIDGRRVGQTNAQGRFVAREVDTGSRRVRVELDGYTAWEQNVDVSSTRPTSLTVSLTEAAVGDAPPETADSTPAETPAAAGPAAATPESSAPTAGDGGTGSGVGVYILGVLVLLALVGVGIFFVMRPKSGSGRT